MTVGIVSIAASPVHSGFPKVEAYRLCGVNIAARLEREHPAKPAEILARNATMQCDGLLAPAVEEVVAKASPKQDRAAIIADFRQRSIADLAHKITTRRASNTGLVQ